MAEPEGGYDADFVENLSEDYTCPICQLAVREPRLTHCGHLYCAGCAQRLLRKGKMMCSLCRMELDESQIYPDNATKRHILSLQIRCERLHAGCPWTGELRYQQEHESDCGFVFEECSNQCGASIPRNVRLEHEAHSCPRRNVDCSYCHVSMQHQDLELHHQRDCDSYPIPCVYDCGATVSRSEMAYHVSRNGLCPNRVIECEFAYLGCQFEGKQSELEQHHQTNSSLHLRLVACEFTKTTSEVHDMKDELAFLKQELFRAATQRRLSMPPGQFVYMWRLDKWSQTLSGAKTSVQPSQSSNSFYISTPGFHCCLLALPDGNENSKGHLSLSLQLLRGYYDSQLVWPFPFSFQLAIVDQRRDGKNMTMKYSPPYKRGILDCPTGLGCGSFKFMSHDTLRTNSYIKHDAVLIKLVVDV